MTVSVCRVRLLNDGDYVDEELGDSGPDFPVIVEAEYIEGSKLVKVAGSTLYRAGFRVEGINSTDTFMYGFFLGSEAEIVGPTWPRK